MRSHLLCWAVLLISPLATSSTTFAELFSPDGPQKLDIPFELADGACWSGSGTIFVPDVKAKKLLAIQTNGKELKSWSPLKEPIGISGTTYSGGVIYAADNRGHRIITWTPNRPKSRAIRTLTTFADDQRPNDLAYHPSGEVFVTMTGQGQVFAVDATGQHRVIAEGISRPNGIAISPSGNAVYVSSVSTGAIWKLTQVADQWTKSRFAQLDETPDGFRGDGMTCDRGGNVYCTGADSVTVFSPTGERIDKLSLPHRPINVVLGGADARELFISTFDGLYRIGVNAYAVSPQPDTAKNADTGASVVAKTELKSWFDVPYYQIDGREMLMDIHRPNDDENRPAIVLVHGGGWLKGDKKKFRALAFRLAEAGYVVANTEYRLGYEAKFPAALHDCNAATKFIRSNAQKYGLNPNQIAAAGGSAGGHIVALMGAGDKETSLQPPNFLSEISSELDAVIVMAGPTEIETGSVAERSRKAKTGSNAYYWLGGTTSEVPDQYALADVINKIDGTMPPTLFITGSKDNPARDAKAIEQMKSKGLVTKQVIHEEATHGHWNRPDWIMTVVEDIDAFLQAELPKP
ncbi:MAG: SMP-30/gluconolactonase/LRE family protein [Planctomycetota bacterium]